MKPPLFLFSCQAMPVENNSIVNAIKIMKEYWNGTLLRFHDPES